MIVPTERQRTSEKKLFVTLLDVLRCVKAWYESHGQAEWQINPRMEDGAIDRLRRVIINIWRANPERKNREESMAQVPATPWREDRFWKVEQLPVKGSAGVRCTGEPQWQDDWSIYQIFTTPPPAFFGLSLFMDFPIDLLLSPSRINLSCQVLNKNTCATVSSNKSQSFTPLGKLSRCAGVSG